MNIIISLRLELVLLLFEIFYIIYNLRKCINLMKDQHKYEHEDSHDIEIPEPMDWKEPSGYQSGVYTLTFDNVEFFETRDGIYRHYRIESEPFNYPRPTPPKLKSYDQIWNEYELEGELGIHSPSSSV